MKSSRNLLISNVFIFLISSSVGGKELGSAESRFAQYDEEESEMPIEVPDHFDEDIDECTEAFTTFVECKYEGIRFVLTSEKQEGTFYVSNHQNDKNCKQDISRTSRNTSLVIPFGKCGLTKSREVFMNITILPSDKVVNSEAAVFRIRCAYPPTNSTVSQDLPLKEVSYNPDAPTHVTGPPKIIYIFNITKITGPGEQDKLHADIMIRPKVLGARARNCKAYAKNDTSISMILTDSDGCPEKSSEFPGWKWNKEENKLEATFPSFHLIGADTTGMNCSVKACLIESECGTPCPKADSQRRKCKSKSQ